MSRNVTGKTKLFGVIGTPIEHSCSPKMHNAAFDALGLDYEYLAFEVGTGYACAGGGRLEGAGRERI